jgi:transcriptional regulator with XRE-family HTH domain
MTSFQISISPTERAAGRFVTRVRRELQKALAEENKKRGLTQSDVARTIGVHRSVINRELRGAKDITLGRVAQLAHAMGRKPVFSASPVVPRPNANVAPASVDKRSVVVSSTADDAVLPEPAPVHARAA